MKQHSVSVINVPRETLNKTESYFDSNSDYKEYLNLLFHENQSTNLISRKMDFETARLHVIHSLLAFSLGLLKNSARFIDIGTGGGLPGIPLALSEPTKPFILNDNSVKKQLALNRIVKGLSLTNCSMIQDDTRNVVHYDTITILSKHAFKLPELIACTKKIRWDKIILWKGDDFQTELRDIDYKPLTVEAFDLSDLGEFFEGKYILKITR